MIDVFTLRERLSERNEPVDAGTIRLTHGKDIGVRLSAIMQKGEFAVIVSKFKTCL